MRVFGKAVFGKKKVPQLYDFAQHGLLRMGDRYGGEYATPVAAGETEKSAPKLKKKELSPKQIYVAKTLHQPGFQVNKDPEYIDEQIALLKDKLVVLGPGRGEAPGFMASARALETYVAFSEDGAVRYGRFETESMIERLANRKQLTPEKEAQFNEWAYTTNDAVRDLLGKETHLEAKIATASVPDLPAEAISTIQIYEQITKDIAGKRPVFYLIAPKADRNEIDRKRDPILLAQSPFGFFWQILGAWDEEIKFLDEL